MIPRSATRGPSVIFRLLIAAGATLLLLGCRHNPQYPGIGSLYITSNPGNAEVLIDGQTTQRQTPAKIDGLTVGAHQVTLRHSNSKVLTQTVDIKPGVIRRVFIQLQPMNPRQISRVQLPTTGLDMIFDPVRQRLYVTHEWGVRMSVYQVSDSAVTWQRYITVGLQQGKLTLHSGAGKMYITIADTIKVLDLNDETTHRWLVPAPGVSFSQLVFSHDGRTVLAADSAGRRILAFDARADTVLRVIPLPGTPSDLAIDAADQHCYVTLSDTRRFLRINLQTGGVVNEQSTAPNPGRIFRDDNDEYVGYCRTRKDPGSTYQNFFPIRLASWTPFVTPTLQTGTQGKIDLVWGAEFAKDRVHFWIFTVPYPDTGSPAPLPIGRLFLFYIPSWQGVAYGASALGQWPERMVQSVDGRYLYILEYRDILVLRTDTEMME